MPKVYVAFRTDPDGLGVRCASGSETIIKKRIRQVPNSLWAIAEYKLKPDTITICQSIEDITQIPHEHIENYKVTDAGQVRKDPNGHH